MNSQPRILIVDDEAHFRTILSRALKSRPYQVIIANSQKEAYSLIQSDMKIDLALIDIHLTDGSGLDLMTDIKSIYPDTKVIILTGYGTIELAVQAKQRGATHFITKPFSIEEVLSNIDNILSQKKLEFENGQLKVVLDSKNKSHNIIGQSPGIYKVIQLIERVSVSNSTILITGASGTGKELVAKAIHSNSPRARKPFIPLNCSAIPSELLESELFGHRKGAFTNAIAHRAGHFELAEGGTLFLDEIGDMSPQLQVKLLRVIQEKTFTPVGGTKSISANVRILAATHVNLEEAVACGRFREDLYYRLNVIPLRIPSLKERKTDIPILLHHFMEKFNKEIKSKLEGFNFEAMELLCAYNWPGNIRELENLIERLSILKGTGIINTNDLPSRYAKVTANNPHRIAPEDFIEIPNDGLDFNAEVRKYENKLLIQALKKTNWNRNRAAALLKLNRTTLVEKIKKRGLCSEKENSIPSPSLQKPEPIS